MRCRIATRELELKGLPHEMITMMGIAQNCRLLDRYIESHLNHQIFDATPVPFAFARLEAFSS